MLQTLLENWTVIDTGVAIAITIVGFIYTSIRNLRSDMFMLWKDSNQRIDKMHNLMLLYIINPVAAKKEAAEDYAKQKAEDPPKE